MRRNPNILSELLEGVGKEAGFFYAVSVPMAVCSVIVLQSTGHDLLDRAGISAFQRWRFKPGLLNAVKIPLNFSMHHGIRHRMAGAVIAD